MLPSNNFFQKHCKERGIPFRKKEILREYLQMQTLQALSVSGFNDSLSFLGGTALRFGFGIDRFSEDLDFDLLDGKNFSVEEFDREIRDKLKSFGLKTDTRVRETENIYILYLKFRDVLREFGFNVPRDQKLLVKFEIDTSPLKSIETQTILVDSFNERFPLLFNDKRTLFAQEICRVGQQALPEGEGFL